MAEAATKQKVVRVTVDLKVDEDTWNEKVEQGCTEKYLVGEVKRTLNIPAGRYWRDVEVQGAEVVEVGGPNGKK